MNRFSLAAAAAALVSVLLVLGCAPGGGGSSDGGTINLDGGPGDLDSGSMGTDATTMGTDAAFMNLDAGGSFDMWTPDPDPGDSGMPLWDASVAVFGPAVVVDTMTVASLLSGHDLDGDGTPDNALAAIPFGLDMINQAIAGAIADGTISLLMEFRGVEDPTLMVDDTMMTFAIYNGIATGVPGQYLVDPISLDAMGLPMFIFFDAMISNAPVLPVFTGSRNSLPFAFPGFGMFMLVDPRITGNPTPNFTEMQNGLLCGVIQACSLSMIPDPIFGSGSMLDLMLGLGITPDIDLSGDGLETFTLSMSFPQELVSCTDGDGTVISSTPGSPCACDPRIEDGISMAMDFHANGATIVGVGP